MSARSDKYTTAQTKVQNAIDAIAAASRNFSDVDVQDFDLLVQVASQALLLKKVYDRCQTEIAKG